MSKDKHKEVNYSHKILEVKDLEKHFYVGSGKNKLVVPAVDNITFDIFEREVFGLVGESGSGKTTAGRTIIKLYNPTNGTVKLDGVKIGAGYRGNLIRLKKIANDRNRQIRLLDDHKQNIYKIKQQTRKELQKIDSLLDKAKYDYDKKVEKIQLPIENYKKELYLLKNNHSVDAASIEYAFIQERKRVTESGENKASLDYNNEKSIQEKIYSQKIDAIKDSGALTKQVRSQELVKLAKAYEQTLMDLQESFAEDIDKDKANLVSKDIVKAEVIKLNIAKKAELAKLKKTYLEARAKVSQPDKKAIKLSIKEVKAVYDEQVAKLKAEKKVVKLKGKEQLVNLPVIELTVTEKEEIKAKINDINEETKKKMDFEKTRIKQLKSINSSKDSLLASRKMQMIFQDPISSLNPRMTVKEIVGEGLQILGGFTPDQITEMVSDTLELVGLSREYATRYPHEFSGGQRQRIGIARALIMKPDFIIADEPISALDVSIQAQVINLLNNIKDELGLTIMFIAHDLSVVRHFCDRIAVMFRGKIVELASSEELFKNPVHPYTISLLSAIPQPDPDYEKGRKRSNYDAMMHDYSVDKPSLREIAPGHEIYVNDAEFKVMKEQYDKNNAKSTKAIKGDK